MQTMGASHRQCLVLMPLDAISRWPGRTEGRLRHPQVPGAVAADDVGSAFFDFKSGEMGQPRKTKIFEITRIQARAAATSNSSRP